MEDEKKKKKNKKKKNKQTKTTGDVVTHGIGESTNEDQNHVIGQNHHYQVLETTDVQHEVPKTDVDLDLDRRCINGTKDASLEETIKKIQKENDTRIQKEACLEEKITTLQKENATHIQKEASLEETIKNLQKENDTHMQKEASLEMKLLQLQSEKDSWLQKEAGFEEKINKLTDETAILSLKGAIQKNNLTHRRVLELRKTTRQAVADAEAKSTELEEARKWLAELRSENGRLTDLANSVEAEKQKVAAEAKDKYLRLLAKLEKKKDAEIKQLKKSVKAAEKQGFKEAENAYTLQCDAAKDLFFKCGWRSAVEQLGCGPETEVYNAPQYSIPASLVQYAADLQKQFLGGSDNDEDDDDDDDDDDNEPTITPAINEQPNDQTVRLKPVVEDLTDELQTDNTQPIGTEVHAETELLPQTVLQSETGLRANVDAEFDAELDNLLN